MITFKQFLAEASIESLAAQYVKNCAGWPNVERPLWRYSLTGGNEGQERETRDRSKVKGGTGMLMNWLFEKPAWAGFPQRTKSVFCSTTEDFEVGAADSDTTYAIYPYDGVNMAMTDAVDFNLIYPFTGKFSDNTLHEMMYEIRASLDNSVATMSVFNKFKAMRLENSIESADTFDAWFKEYKALLDDNEVDSSSRKRISAVVDALENLTPEAMKCEKVTPATIDMGSQHEVWFEGKYLMIPKPKLSEFINAVHGLTK